MMKLLIAFLSALLVPTYALSHEQFLLSSPSSCTYYSDCTVAGQLGVCTETSCCSGGQTTAGLCPGGNDVQCCVGASCSTPQGSGTCESTADCTNGTSISGYCVGSTALQCCVGGTPANASTLGVDIQDPLSSSNAACLLSSGWTYVITRAWHSYGAYDTSACGNIQTAHQAGMKYADVYMFPCPTCSSSAQNQLADMISSLKDDGCTSTTGAQGSNNFGMVWLDIEGSQYWYSSSSSNQKFFNDLVSECKALGLDCGVYTSASQWNPIMGSAFTGGSSLPLWYAHYDNNPSFSDFAPFGGWTKPYMKQFNGDKTVCSMDLDENFTPYQP